MPFADGSYATLFYATVVIDFISDEEAILGIPLKQLRAFGSCYIAQT